MSVRSPAGFPLALTAVLLCHASGALAQQPTPSPQPDGLDSLDDLGDLDALDELDALQSASGGEGATGVSLRSSRGSLGVEYRFFPRQRRGRLKDHQWRFDLELELDLALPAGFTLLLRPWFFVDAYDPDLLRYEPLEGYLRYDAEHWDLLVGQFIESWGIADAFNPLDVLNRRDLGTDLLDPVVRGELGARLRLHHPGGSVIGEPALSLYALPLFRRTPFPTAHNRFSLERPRVDFRPQDSRAPGVGAADAVFAAARIEHTLSTGWINADWQYLAARGPEDFPLLAARASSAGVALVPEYFGAWTLGGGFRAVANEGFLAKYTLKAEVAYKRPYRLKDATLPAPQAYTQFAVGVDRQLSPAFSTRDQLTLMVEYLGEAGAHDRAHELRPFTADLAGRVLWEARDLARTSVELRGIVDMRNGEVLVEGHVGRQLRFIHEDLRFDVGGQYLRAAGEQQSLLSLFPNNSNLRARLHLAL